MQRPSWDTMRFAVFQREHSPENTADIEHIVPEGQGTLDDQDLGMVPSSQSYRVPSKSFKGAPSGAVIVDAAAKKRERQYEPISINDLWKKDKEEYYYSSSSSSVEEDSDSESGDDDEEEGEYDEYDYDKGDGMIVVSKKRKRNTEPQSLFSSESSCYSDSEDSLFCESSGEKVEDFISMGRRTIDAQHNDKLPFRCEDATDTTANIPSNDPSTSSSQNSEITTRSEAYHRNRNLNEKPKKRKKSAFNTASNPPHGYYNENTINNNNNNGNTKDDGIDSDDDDNDDDDDVCPLCLSGNTEFDKIACEKAYTMWNLLATTFFSLSSTKMCAHVCYAYYREEWYKPSKWRAKKARERGKKIKPLPKWSPQGMEKHITEHMGEPRIFLGTSIERMRKLETLMNNFCFEINGEGELRPNLSVINQIRMLNKHIIDLYKTDPREMYGYCESWEANPKDMNRFINLSRCKITPSSKNRNK